MLAVQAEVGLVKVRSNVPEEDSVNSIKPSQSVVSMVMFKPVEGINKSLKFCLTLAFSVMSVTISATAISLMVGVMEASDIVYSISAFIGDGPPVA